MQLLALAHAIVGAKSRNAAEIKMLNSGPRTPAHLVSPAKLRTQQLSYDYPTLQKCRALRWLLVLPTPPSVIGVGGDHCRALDLGFEYEFVRARLFRDLGEPLTPD